MRARIRFGFPNRIKRRVAPVMGPARASGVSSAGRYGEWGGIAPPMGWQIIQRGESSVESVFHVKHVVLPPPIGRPSGLGSSSLANFG